jgi:hypothetical protein
MSAKKKSDRSFAEMVDADIKVDQNNKEASTSPSPYDKKP